MGIALNALRLSALTMLALLWLPSHTRAANASTFTCSESYSDRIVSSSVNSVTYSPIGNGPVISATISLVGTDITQFNENTTFHYNINGWTCDATLGIDPRYIPGRSKHATLVTEVAIARLNWTATRLTVTIRDFGEPFNDVYLRWHGANSGPINDSLPATIAIGDRSVDFDVAITGRVTTRHVFKSGFDVALSSISFRGRGTAP